MPLSPGFRLVVLAALLGAVPVVAQTGRTSIEAGPSHDGHEITCDLPGKEHIKNIGSRLDGAGMCVFSSIEMAALHQGLEQMRGWRDWCAAKYPGGGWPDKVDRCLADWFKHKGIEPIPYQQYEGRSPEELLDLIDRTGRMASITYGYSPRYGRTIAHMVCAPMYRGKYGVVLDNNFPGESRYEWMAREELVRRMKIGSGSAWVHVWLPPGPPPVPKNRG